MCAGSGGAGTDGGRRVGGGVEAPARTGGAQGGWQRPGASAGLLKVGSSWGPVLLPAPQGPQVARRGVRAQQTPPVVDLVALGLPAAVAVPPARAAADAGRVQGGVAPVRAAPGAGGAARAGTEQGLPESALLGAGQQVVGRRPPAPGDALPRAGRVGGAGRLLPGALPGRGARGPAAGGPLARPPRARRRAAPRPLRPPRAAAQTGARARPRPRRVGPLR